MWCSRSGRLRRLPYGSTASTTYVHERECWFGSNVWPPGNPGDVKPVGEGVSELRIDYGPGYRVYFTKVGRKIVVLLGGGSKKTQDADIRAAIKLAEGL